MSKDTIKILIVDDNKNNLLSLHELIESEFDNVHVVEADSGIAALSFLMKKIVDLIILDIQMPQMDGFETAKIIQTRIKTRHIPIVFLTAAYKSKEFMEKGFDVGAVDYLTKPINSIELIGKIKTYVRFIEQEYHQAMRKEVIDQKVEKRVAELSKSSTKQEFVDSQPLKKVSGELQTSLNAIIGYNENLRKEAVNLGYKDCLSEIHKISWESKQLQELLKICRA